MEENKRERCLVGKRSMRKEVTMMVAINYIYSSIDGDDNYNGDEKGDRRKRMIERNKQDNSL